MRRGRPPMPTHLRLLQGNPQKRPLSNDEPEPTIPPHVPEPADFIYGYALDEWHRIVPELHALGLLTVADIRVLEAYCQAYGRWREAEEALARVRQGDPVMHGLIIRIGGGAGTPVENPLVRIARNAAKDMLRYAIEFGLTPVARAHLSGSSIPSVRSKFGDLLA